MLLKMVVRILPGPMIVFIHFIRESTLPYIVIRPSQGSEGLIRLCVDENPYPAVDAIAIESSPKDWQLFLATVDRKLPFDDRFVGKADAAEGYAFLRFKRRNRQLDRKTPHRELLDKWSDVLHNYRVAGDESPCLAIELADIDGNEEEGHGILFERRKIEKRRLEESRKGLGLVGVNACKVHRVRYPRRWLMRLDLRVGWRRHILQNLEEFSLYTIDLALCLRNGCLGEEQGYGN